MSDIRKAGTTDQQVELRMLDSSTGDPETGVTSATSGLELWYRREGGLKVTFAASDLSALNDAHSDGGILHVSDGYYRVDVPDAAFAGSADFVVVGWSATGMVGIAARVQLVTFDPQDTVRLGLTALPNAAADAAGGLVVSDAGGFDIDNRAPAAAAVTNMNTVFNTDFAANYDTTTDAWRTDVKAISGDTTAADNAELFYDGTGYNAANSTIGTVTTATAVTTVNGLANNVITTASINNAAITMAKLGTVDGVDFADFAEAVQAVLFGITAVGVNQVEFKARDGTTTKVTVTYTGTSGERDGSTIA